MSTDPNSVETNEPISSREAQSPSLGDGSSSPTHENARICTIAADHNNRPSSLSFKQIRAIELIMRGMSVGRIAVSCEIDESTLYRWRHEDEEFIAELNRRRRTYWDESADRVRALLSPAISVLAEQVNTGYEHEKLRAAATILRLLGVRSAIAIPEEEK